jgi:hypothetical protein
MNKLILTIITSSIFLLSGCELEPIPYPPEPDLIEYIEYAYLNLDIPELEKINGYYEITAVTGLYPWEDRHITLIAETGSTSEIQELRWISMNSQFVFYDGIEITEVDTTFTGGSTNFYFSVTDTSYTDINGESYFEYITPRLNHVGDTITVHCEYFTGYDKHSDSLNIIVVN